MVAKPFNKHLGIVREFFWYPFVITVACSIFVAFFVHPLHGNDPTFPQLMLSYVIFIAQICSSIVLPMAGIILCIHGLRTIDRKMEDGFRDGVIRLVLLTLYAPSIVFPVLYLGMSKLTN